MNMEKGDKYEKCKQRKKSHSPKESKSEPSSKSNTVKAASLNVNGKRNLSVDRTKDTAELQNKKQKQVNTNTMVKSAPSLSKSQKRRFKRKIILQKLTTENKVEQDNNKTDTANDGAKTAGTKPKKKRWKKKRGKLNISDDSAQTLESIQGSGNPKEKLKQTDAKTVTQKGNNKSRLHSSHKTKLKSKLIKSPIKAKSEQESLDKVHTHASLYRNPVDVSSNWKQLLQVFYLYHKLCLKILHTGCIFFHLLYFSQSMHSKL